MKRTFENCSIRKRAARIFNDTTKLDNGKCKGFKNLDDTVIKECKYCKIREGNQ